MIKRIWCWLLCGNEARELERNALIGGGYLTKCQGCGCVRRYPPGSRGYDSKLAGR